jgi:hypothetical protein
MSKTNPRVRKAWFSKSASGLLVVVQVLAAKASNHHGAELTDLVDLPGIFCVFLHAFCQAFHDEKHAAGMMFPPWIRTRLPGLAYRDESGGPVRFSIELLIET